MAISKRRTDFLESDEGKEIKSKLEQMARNSLYNTTSTYSVNSALYPDNLIPFADKHINYLIDHPNLEPNKYLANLRLMVRVR